MTISRPDAAAGLLVVPEVVFVARRAGRAVESTDPRERPVPCRCFTALADDPRTIVHAVVSRSAAGSLSRSPPGRSARAALSRRRHAPFPLERGTGPRPMPTGVEATDRGGLLQAISSVASLCNAGMSLSVRGLELPRRPDVASGAGSTPPSVVDAAAASRSLRREERQIQAGSASIGPASTTRLAASPQRRRARCLPIAA